MPDTWNIDQAIDKIGDDEKHTVRKDLETKLAAGKGIAIYENQDLGHPYLGYAVGLTYGTPEAQFEPASYPDGPPEQCPDGLLREITGGINWRYRLVAVVPPRGADNATVA